MDRIDDAETQEAHDPLTYRQARFVFEYLKDQNASAAAVRAGYCARSAASQASDLMQKPAVRERIRMEMQGLLAELQVSALDLIKERMRAAFFRAGKLFDAQGRFLALEEMEADTRDALFVSVVLRKGEPEIRLRQPNREKALAALERVHERLERLNEQRYAQVERDAWTAAPEAAPAAAPVASAPVMPESLRRLREAVQAAPEHMMGEAETVAAPPVAGRAPSDPVAKEGGHSRATPGAPMAEAEPAPVPSRAAPEAAIFAEKPQVLSGSPDKAAKPSMLAKVVAALVPQKESKEPKRDAAFWRRDPNLLWGGTPKPAQAPEPSPALAEHLARVRHQELNAEVSREMAARGGKIRPGPVRPAGRDPGYNPPWLRDSRPLYAVGAGEFYFSGEEDA